MISSWGSSEAPLAVSGKMGEETCASMTGLLGLALSLWSFHEEGTEFCGEEFVDLSLAGEVLMCRLSSFLLLIKPLLNCCDQRRLKCLSISGALMTVIVICLASGSVSRSCSLKRASDSCSSTEKSELIRRAFLLMSIPCLRPLLPRDPPSSSASVASSSSSSQPALSALSSSGSSTLISTLLSRIHSSPCKPSWRSRPPKIGPSSGCSPSSSSRQSSQIGSRKLLWTTCWMEHCRISFGRGSLLLKVEPAVEIGERSDEEELFDIWTFAGRRRGVCGGQVTDGRHGSRWRYWQPHSR